MERLEYCEQKKLFQSIFQSILLLPLSTHNCEDQLHGKKKIFPPWILSESLLTDLA